MCGDFGEETIGLRQRDFWGQRLAQNSFLMAFAFCIVPVSNPIFLHIPVHYIVGPVLILAFN